MRKEDSYSRREVITLLPQNEHAHVEKTTLVQLYNNDVHIRIPLIASAKQALNEIGEDNLKYYAAHTYSGMGRTEAVVDIGAAVPCAPGLWISMKHVSFRFRDAFRVEIPPSNELSHLSYAYRKPLVPIITDADYHYFDAMVRGDREPLFGEVDEFSAYFDLCIAQGPVVDPILPDFKPVKLGDSICVVSYNGYPQEVATNKLLDAVYGSSAKKPSFAYTSELFFGLGRKAGSFGNVLAADKGILTYDCSLFSGASGGFIVATKDKNKLFCGFHEGGDFHVASETPYNYGYSTNHAAVVVMYAKYVYPAFKAAGGIPPHLVQYFSAHKDIIEAHKAFINNDIASILID